MFVRSFWRGNSRALKSVLTDPRSPTFCKESLSQNLLLELPIENLLLQRIKITLQYRIPKFITTRHIAR